MKPAVVRGAFVAGPVLLLAGVVAMKFGWKGNTGLDWGVALPLWTGAHLAYVLGYLAFGVVLAAMWGRARRNSRHGGERVLADVLGVAGAVGLIASLGQMIIDLIVGFRADDRAGMSALFQSYQDIPGFEAVFYGVVPSLALGAISLLVVLLTVRRDAAPWAAALFVAGAVCVGTQVTALMVLGGVALCLALPALREPATPPVPVPA
ncbi:hypothetical protein [Amycolatopsis magusensis]|uniref:Uncharacterized protein n=1 Tax=Amycolatopsis magusensis TaxID=882444 RepID=A0ABS4Q5G2_9PSEU|nr:hypothetical protein [Amycolatopsis magusensis]MBP2186925.1 hypothetical protein [Amycolatopsis magusensis]